MEIVCRLDILNLGTACNWQWRSHRQLKRKEGMLTPVMSGTLETQLGVLIEAHSPQFCNVSSSRGQQRKPITTGCWWNLWANRTQDTKEMLWCVKHGVSLFYRLWYLAAYQATIWFFRRHLQYLLSSVKAIRGKLIFPAFFSPTVRNHKARNAKSPRIAESPDEDFVFGLSVLSHILEYWSQFRFLRLGLRCQAARRTGTIYKMKQTQFSKMDQGHWTDIL